MLGRKKISYIGPAIWMLLIVLCPLLGLATGMVWFLR